jgi:AraC-like DNA-binding protein
MKAFILDQKPKVVYEVRLFTLVEVRIIPSAINHSDLQELIDQLVSQYNGRIVQQNSHTFVISFEGPSKAAHCSIDLIKVMRSKHVQLRIGILIKESAVDEAHFISDETASLIESIFEKTTANQILITQTVRYLLYRAGLNFKQHTSILEKYTGQSHLLFVITDHLEMHHESEVITPFQHQKQDSFLENVLQQIENNLSNESFGVDMLLKEMCMSERQNQRKLKAITNKSPNQLISSVRLHCAKELLIRQEYNIAEIAFKTGFSNPSYFTKSFKKEFGVTPSELLQNQYCNCRKFYIQSEM